MMPPLFFMFIIITLAPSSTTNPLMMGLLLFCLALLTTLIISIQISPWPALILFIIFISGVLVMFCYFLSTQPNQPLKITMPLLSMLVNMLFIIILAPHLSSKFNIHSPSAAPLMHSNNVSMLTILTLTLLLTMIIVVYNTLLSGSMRPFMKRD